jgi:tetratricopeptide (TPR) repeat protein
MLLAIALTGGAAAGPGDPLRRANELFALGKRALSRGDLPAACAHFEESQRLAPRGGTLLNLALCHEQQGKLAEAARELREALAAAQKDGRVDREPIAREHLAAIEKRLAAARRELLAAAENSLADGRAAEACDLAGRALTSDPDAPDLLRLLGRCHMRMRRPDEGRIFFRRYLARAPEAPDAAFIRAIVQEGAP